MRERVLTEVFRSGREVALVPFRHGRKGALARGRRVEPGVGRVPIGVWSCLEARSTYRTHFDAKAGFPRLRAGFSRCKHPYFYYDHAGYGFMGVRPQTRFPFWVQIAPSGREWPRRSLIKGDVEFVVHGDKFPHLGDYERARELPDAQVDTRRVETLAGFLPAVFPSMAQALGPGLSHCWTLWQSGWATGYAFESRAAPRPLAGGPLRQAPMTGTCESVLRHMGRPVDAGGRSHPRADPEVLTRAGPGTRGSAPATGWTRTASKCVERRHPL